MSKVQNTVKGVVLYDLSYSLAGLIPAGTELIGEVLTSRLDNKPISFLVTEGEYQEINADIEAIAIVETVQAADTAGEG